MSTEAEIASRLGQPKMVSLWLAPWLFFILSLLLITASAHFRIAPPQIHFARPITVGALLFWLAMRLTLCAKAKGSWPLVLGVAVLELLVAPLVFWFWAVCMVAIAFGGPINLH